MAGITRKAVLDNFSILTAIPRKSGNEAGVAHAIAEWGEKRGYKSLVDDANNVVVSVPATAGRENEPGVIIQGHIDMVCEKTPESKHDFASDPITTMEKNGKLVADGTTLGADDGIAIAMAMAVAEGASHPALEIFGTAGEEVGMVGARAFKPGILKGTRLLNIDSEEEGTFYIGCAGGARAEITFPIKRVRPKGKNLIAAHVVIGGMSGGHSGSEAYKCKGNAIFAMQRFFKALERSGKPFWVDKISGGSADNAIPRDSDFVAIFDTSDDAAISETTLQLVKDLKQELREVEPGLTIDVNRVEGYEMGPALSSESLRQLSNFLAAFPAGIFQRNMQRDGLVEASENLASIVTHEKHIAIRTSIRGNYDSLKWAVVDRLKSYCEMAGVKVEVLNPYPAWPAMVSSSLTDKAKDVFTKLFGKTPAIEVIHAGLECGMIASKYPDLDMLSFGPELTEAHTPQEALDLGSLDRMMQFLEELLKII